jgi:hypothetical protein
MISRRGLIVGSAAAGLSLHAGPARAQLSAYRWPGNRSGRQSIADRFPPPPGFSRSPAPSGSFADWLRHLPLLPHEAPVMLHDGRAKPRQDVHAAVVDIDIGRRDLQQCADAIMRLRAEWLFANGAADRISFNATGGEPIPFARWARGERPRFSGRRINWSQRAAPDQSHTALRAYLDVVFIYAGTWSLERELVPASAAAVEIGDVYIKGGFPGHAVLVVDAAVDTATGRRRLLVAQSYMPAQSIHVLRNPHDGGGPWYAPPADGSLVTPEWTFLPGSLKRWKS